ncbi:alpha/beta fold hydrolase [Denitromonas iodatirespirans]|uniref:Alpha/beta hydrolase n=1 Tax=Denitromonas iodatirespirans TaxID=2795389 RepID=A0A944DDY0_DENI1|nr:alpha/beta hydrolase [Denitromonas iodatirespirans]MBT0962567.1 alpha/beta hydrolase [Denitromonas iodatirespirans]
MSPPIPIVALPGTMCDARLWHRLLPHLPGVAWQHLPIPDGPDIDHLVSALAESLPAGPVNLFGFSLGGYLAAALACRLPGRIGSLFICANSPCALPERELRQRQQLLAWLKRGGYQGLSDHKVAQMVSPASLADPAIGQCMKAMDASLGLAVLEQQLRATTERPDLCSALSALSIPVWMAFGAEDALVDRRWVQDLQVRAPRTVVHEVPGAGHMLPLEAPQALARLVARWSA